ncbi:glycosyltransferase family 2 protein [Vibrio gallicus]|uniref:glycosyltransferase family 2 protein n=1 Tax=Vibrio gallicus TaxID=190897 RepID=UPI0021C3E821|nr:glycosyltransferase family A protein [Vibrio gallicus]
MSDKVSIIMPAYNASQTISKSIQSVIQQTYVNWELIIVNDRSTDNTTKIIESHANNDGRIRLFNNTNEKGVVGARNKAIELAKGTYIAFLDSDDYWEPEKLNIQIDLLLRSENVHASHSSYRRVNQDYIFLSEVACKPLVTYKDMLKYNNIGNLTGIYNCKAIGKIYQKNIGHEDFEMWLNILKLTDSIGSKECLANYYCSANSLSSNKIKSAKWHLDILRSELSGRSNIYIYWNFLHYIIVNIFKRLI